MNFYSLFVPSAAVGANKIYFDLFNATGSASFLEVHVVQPVVSGAVAVSGLLAVDLFLRRTTAVGTGGTAATKEGTSPTACTISGITTTTALDGSITARLAPSGGANAGAVLDWVSVFTEETSASTYTQVLNLARPPGLAEVPPLLVPEGTGISVVQGSVASVGNIGFNVVFKVVKK